MTDHTGLEPKTAGYETTTERTSQRDLVVRRLVRGTVRRVYEAWTRPELMMRWWAPTSFGISFLSCSMDVRTGGSYRFEFGHPASDQPMAFFGTYLEVVPHQRLVWTNAEAEDGAVTTVTFQDRGGETLVVVHDLHPSGEALDAAVASGSTGAFPEQFLELDALLQGGTAAPSADAR